MCVVAIGLTGVQERSLLRVPQKMTERISCLQCSKLELDQASTFSSIRGVKGTSLLLLLTDQYAGKLSGLPGHRPTKVTRCERTSLTIIRVSILNLHL